MGNKRFWVYILLCADDRYYVGMTSNIERRMEQHRQKRFPRAYTAARLPVTLVFLQEFSEARHARSYERKLKGWSHRKKEALIENDVVRLHLLAECRNETHYRNKPAVRQEE